MEREKKNGLQGPSQTEGEGGRACGTEVPSRGRGSDTHRSRRAKPFGLGSTVTSPERGGDWSWRGRGLPLTPPSDFGPRAPTCGPGRGRVLTLGGRVRKDLCLCRHPPGWGRVSISA